MRVGIATDHGGFGLKEDLVARLRAAGHALNPLVQIGKEGLTEAVLAQVARTVADHELVKVRLGESAGVDRIGPTQIFNAGPFKGGGYIVVRTVDGSGGRLDARLEFL